MVPVENGAVFDKVGFGSSGGGYQKPIYGHSSAGYEHAPPKGKKSIALSALTLLAFLFFLHILQTCIQDHITSMNTQVVVIPGAKTNEQKYNPDRRHKGEIEEANDDDYEWDSGETKDMKGEMHRIQAKVKFDDVEKK